MTGGESLAPPAHPTFAEAARVWAAIGFLGFGGPAGQIALMHRMLVEERKWISETRFLHALNFCMLLPGPEAQQLATYVGWLLHGTRGGIVAGTLFVIPGLVVILALSAIYTTFRGASLVESLFFGLKAAVLAIVIEAVIRIGRRALKTRVAVILAVAAFVAIYVLHIPFPAIVIGAGILGFILTRISPGMLGSNAGTAGGGAVDAILDNGGPRAEPTLGRAVRVILVWGLLWAAPIVLFGLAGAFDSFYPELALFFSKMAVVTFGGAYAVLAYVAEAAVNAYGWLTPGEMLDGLALAETTPGPLVLVLTFVGYVAGYHAAPIANPMISGLIGGLLVTWVTFVPCFLWIFLGAPYVEKIRQSRALSGALAAITAAVVGVIANLALFLGLHVLFRQVGTLGIGPFNLAVPIWNSIDPWAVALFLAASICLFGLRLGMIPTLAVAAALGITVRFVLAV